MTFDELQAKVGEYLYTEDTGMARIAIASIIANRLKLGNPTWLILIGPSSSGKTQLLRPLALTDTKFIHRVDDLTENTFLSAYNAGKDGGEVSFLKQIGKLGILVISDLTGIFSKSEQTRATILAQLRMIYDGEMTKKSGNKSQATSWEGYIGMLAGATPFIYSHFEEVADMGERFLYYRMKPYNDEQATWRSLKRPMIGKELDKKLSSIYKEYIEGCAIPHVGKDVPLMPEEIQKRIVAIAMFAAKLRTPVHMAWRSGLVDRIPVSEMPMRVALQLQAIAQALMIMQFNEDGTYVLPEESLEALEWCAYSLANEERRSALKIIAEIPFGVHLSTRMVAEKMGLSDVVVEVVLQNLAAIGILTRSHGAGQDGSFTWTITFEEIWNLVRRLENIEKEETQF